MYIGTLFFGLLSYILLINLTAYKLDVAIKIYDLFIIYQLLFAL